ncbi:serine/threonine-protein kinase prpf4B [Achroia grisella]|uniref:serine/threonine-protein kinase prpf4B n=1 Tax=Achroia grisella TaxID=688607 RepID=UPI0027D2E7C2|nr:serine/threonine-protein kinase prpf4B [Achroia grisella]
MLSDESSSDSETGRFKCRSSNQDQQKKSTNQNEDSSKHSGRNHHSLNERHRRDLDKKRNQRDNFDRHVRERHRYSRYSPASRRRSSRDRSQDRRSRERHRDRYRDSRGTSKPRDHRSSSKDKHRNSGSQFKKSPDQLRDFKDEIRRNIRTRDERKVIPSDQLEKRKREEPRSSLNLSPDQKGKKSEVYRPPVQSSKNKTSSPIIVEHSEDSSEEVQPGSYYSMIPAIVKEKSEESSEIDSSDDEKLRAKLLNLENELQKTRKKKHKKKHKRKVSKCSKDREQESTTSVEVSSTTDIQNKIEVEEPNNNPEIAEVTSTQKSNQKESCEEGEISSDEEPDDNFKIDPNDLRHKLKRSVTKCAISGEKSASDVCGPALPPHLKKQFASSSDMEGPALPPHLNKRSRNIGPSIPDDMRKVLESECEIIKGDTSDEEEGIGPLPIGAEEKWTDAHKRLEERALDMKIKHLDGHSLQSNKVKSREQWMLELPEAKAKYLGLEARSFRSKEGPDMSDRSTWTDTPEEKARKESGIVKEEDADILLQKEAKVRQIANRDEEQETAVRKHKKKHKREESLLDMHQKKLKKKKKKDEREDGKKERRPFSRDVDLQVNRFDEAQKKSIIKKAQNLNTRFSRGEAKYL